MRAEPIRPLGARSGRWGAALNRTFVARYRNFCFDVFGLYTQP